MRTSIPENIKKACDYTWHYYLSVHGPMHAALFGEQEVVPGPCLGRHIRILREAEIGHCAAICFPVERQPPRALPKNITDTRKRPQTRVYTLYSPCDEKRRSASLPAARGRPSKSGAGSAGDRDEVFRVT